MSRHFHQQRKLTSMLICIDWFDRVVTREAGVAELGRQRISASSTGSTVEAFDGDKGERIRANEITHAFEVEFVLEQIVLVRSIDAIKTGMCRRWACNPEMNFCCAGIANHLDDFLRCRSAHDRIVDEYDAFPLQFFAVRIVFQFDAEVPDSV